MTDIEFYPYPLMLGLLALALVMARARKRGWLYLSVLGMFGIYLLGVANHIVFPIRLPERWPAFQTWEGFVDILTGNMNLIPGNYGNMFAHLATGMLAPNIVFWEIAGNILLTVPFGLGMRVLLPGSKRRVGLIALLVGLALEGAQLFIRVAVGPNYHAIDINDVLLNALGVLIGSGLYNLLEWGSRQAKEKLVASRETF